jgi:hypothetical protein
LLLSPSFPLISAPTPESKVSWHFCSIKESKIFISFEVSDFWVRNDKNIRIDYRNNSFTNWNLFKTTKNDEKTKLLLSGS